MKNSDKIIIHGLFSPHLALLLYSLNPRLLKNIYWYIWGGDLYYHIFRNKSFKSYIYEFIRRRVIKNIGNIITPVKGDYELAKEWYKTEAKYHEAFYINPLINGCYDNIFYNINNRRKKTNKNQITIQIGNSADPRNNHLEILDNLSRFKNNNIEIIVPLSYGNQEYAKEIIKRGKYIYNDKFKPLTDFLPREEYYAILSSVDVGLFNHDRQQALGNIFSLLYFGKKVYIKNDITTWDFLTSKGITVYNIYDLDKLNLEELIYIEDSLKEKNRENLQKEFSIEKGIELWGKIFCS